MGFVVYDCNGGGNIIKHRYSSIIVNIKDNDDYN